MHRKHLCTAITLVTAVATGGCASTGESNPTTPVPKALIEAANQASQARMVYADLQARMHGQSVDDVRLDEPDESVPDFLRARVRLDYNGPMMQVLERVGTDIGYRVNEYGKPDAGVGWSPWLRAEGDKPLIDHVREMNTQIPWHLVLDHRNQRLVIDYSADGSMATQIREAREADRARRNQSASPSMPGADSLERRAQHETQAEMSNTPAMATSENRRQPQRSTVEEWAVVIAGYSSQSNAEAMVDWLAEDSMVAHVRESGNQYEVRVLANNERDAQNIKARLDEFNVPASVDSVTVPGDSDASASPRRSSKSPQANQSSSQGVEWDTPGRAGNGRQSTSDINMDQDDAGVAKDAIANDAQQEVFDNSWRVQGAYGANLDSFGDYIKSLSDKGLPAYLVPVSNGMYNLRVGPFDSRSSMESAISVVKQMGFNDAYALSPNQ